MEKNTNAALYKVLNEGRTNGEWTTGGDPSYIHSKSDKKCDWFVKFYEGHECSNRKQAQCNAKYTALAVNNLAPVADALESLVEHLELLKRANGFIEGSLFDIDLQKAIKALKAIS